MDRSPHRMNLIHDYYGGLDIKRISALDGVSLWSDGSCDEFERFNWDDEKLNYLIKNGYIADWYKDYGDARPPEVACLLSHRIAIIDFYESNDPIGIIIEDDTFPLFDLNLFEMPKGVDFYCLLGSDHPGNRVVVNEDNEIKSLRNLSGYALTKYGAELAIDALFPFWCPADMQISLSLFGSINIGTMLPSFKKRGATIKAKAPDLSIIGLSESSRYTTFTCSGFKKWMPTGWESSPYVKPDKHN
jgi:hypothetical protein